MKKKTLAASSKNYNDFEMMYEHARQNVLIGALIDIVTMSQRLQMMCKLPSDKYC